MHNQFQTYPPSGGQTQQSSGSNGTATMPPQQFNYDPDKDINVKVNNGQGQGQGQGQQIPSYSQPPQPQPIQEQQQQRRNPSAGGNFGAQHGKKNNFLLNFIEISCHFFSICNLLGCDDSFINRLCICICRGVCRNGLCHKYS